MKSIQFLLILTCLANLLSAQEMGNYGLQNQNISNIKTSAQFRGVAKTATLLGENVMELRLNALSNQKAFSHTVIFSVVQVGKTVEETNTLCSNRINGFVEDLKRSGIPQEDIFIDLVNFLPKYEYDVTKKLFSKKTYNEIPIGFELQKNLHIRYKIPGTLEGIMAMASRQEIYDIVKVDYFIKDQQAVYKQLRETTFEYLNQIKNNYKTIDVALDSAYVITSENAWVAYPINRYESYQAFASQALDKDEKMGAVVNRAEKQTARFYNAIPANDYDIVINPDILEPCVQFSYNLIVRFTLPERKPQVKVETKKEWMLLSPSGDLKTIKLSE